MINKKFMIKMTGAVVLPVMVCLMVLTTGCQTKKRSEAGIPEVASEAVEDSTVSGEGNTTIVSRGVETEGLAVTGLHKADGGIVQTRSAQKSGPGQTSNVVVTPKEIELKGISSFFTIGPIGDSLFRRIYKKSYKEDCTTPREDLRYLKVLHYGVDGKIYTGEIICHKDISDSLLEIFKELYNNRYPIERIALVDDYEADDLLSAADNNSSCFNFRVSAGTSASLSKHAYGKAIDINPLYNPYVWTDESEALRCDPEQGRMYMDRTGEYPYKIDENDLCYKLFTEHGFSWGGNWEKDKDYMHFSK